VSCCRPPEPPGERSAPTATDLGVVRIVLVSCRLRSAAAPGYRAWAARRGPLACGDQLLSQQAAQATGTLKLGRRSGAHRRQLPDRCHLICRAIAPLFPGSHPSRQYRLVRSDPARVRVQGQTSRGDRSAAGRAIHVRRRNGESHVETFPRLCAPGRGRPASIMVAATPASAAVPGCSVTGVTALAGADGTIVAIYLARAKAGTDSNTAVSTMRKASS
jgi:hypothetical protein